MSNHYTRVVMLFVFVMAIAMAAQRADMSRPARNVPRGMASVSIPTKTEILFSDPVKTGTLFRHTEKIHGPLRVHLDLVGPKPEHLGDVFVVRATVITSAHLDNLHYRWSLPSDVSLVNGQLSGDLDHPNSDTSTELTLQARTESNQQIHVIISGTQGGMTFAEAAQYNTVDQDAINEAHKRLMESTLEYSRGQKIKVFH